MNSYDKTTWVNGGPPAINAAHLNKIEDALAEVIDLANGNHDDLGNRVEYITSSAVDNATDTGKVYYTTTDKALIIPVSAESSQAQFRLDRDGKLYSRRREMQNGSFPSWGEFVDISVGELTSGILQVVIDAGNNLVNEHLTVDGFLDANGAIHSPTDGQITTGFIPCQSGDKFVSSVMTKGQLWQCYVVYNAQKEKISEREANNRAYRFYGDVSELRQTVTITDNNAAFIRFSNGGGEKVSFSVYKDTLDSPKNLAESVGDKAVVCAKATGLNLVDLVGVTDGFVDNDGYEHAPSSNNIENVTEFIPVSYGEAYRARVAAATNNFCLMLYDTDKQFLSRAVSALTDYRFTIDNQNAAYMRISTWKNNLFEVTLVDPLNSNAKNVLENTPITSGYITGSGAIADPSSNQEIVSDYIFVKGDSHIYFHVEVNGEPWLAMAFYNENKALINSRLATNKVTLVLNNRRFVDLAADIPSGASFVRVSCRTYGNASYGAYIGDRGIATDVFDNHLENALSTIRNLNHEGNCNAVNHKGFSRIAPENTLPAFLLSKKMGFSKVECDVALTADFVPVLLHNDTIDDTSDGTGRIDELTWEQVSAYDFGSWKDAAYAGTHIPKFEEFMELCHDIGLHPYIELKNTATFDQEDIDNIVSIVNQNGMRGKCTYISASPQYLEYVKNADSAARLGYVVPVVTITVTTQCQNLKTSDNEVFVDCNYTGLTDEHIESCRTLNIPIEVWTVNDIITMEGLSPYITGVTSDWLNVNVVRHDKWG